MARKIKIQIFTAQSVVFVYDYETSDNSTYNPYIGGMGGFSVHNITTTDLGDPSCAVTLKHANGFETGLFKVADIEDIDIGGSQIFTGMNHVLGLIAPYLFQGSGGGYTYSLTRTITSAEIIEPNTGQGLAQGLVLATAPSGKQFDWRLLWTLNFGTVAYTDGGDIQAKIGGIVVAGIDVEHVTASENRANAFSTGYNIGEYKAPQQGQDFVLFSPIGEFLNGDGTITVTLLYNFF